MTLPSPGRGAALALGLLLLLTSACAGDYVARTAGVRRAYESGDADAALGRLEKLQDDDGSAKDRLLVLLDRGMLLHAQGRWAESIAVLAEAERVAESLDVTSISEEAGVLLGNERQRAYRGEDFEKLMVSVLQALNYAQLGQDEDALVEVRRVNQRLEKMVAEEKKPYEQLAIARYLGAVLYEDQGEWDSAYIDYAQAAELEPDLGALAEPLLRLAKKTGRLEAHERLARRWPGVAHPPLSREEGQLVVVVEAGLVPEKVAQKRRYAAEALIQVPAYQDRGITAAAQVRVAGQTAGAVTVTSLERVAQVHLEDRVARMILKQVASAVVKAGVAGGVGTLTKSDELGWLTFFLLSLGNAPDLRSWLSLPAEFQLARFRLPAGRHEVEVAAAGRTTRHEVQVQPGRVRLLVLRRY